MKKKMKKEVKHCERDERYLITKREKDAEKYRFSIVFRL